MTGVLGPVCSFQVEMIKKMCQEKLKPGVKTKNVYLLSSWTLYRRYKSEIREQSSISFPAGSRRPIIQMLSGRDNKTVLRAVEIS